MDENSSNEDEQRKDSPSPKLSVKKLKMNDGSSQDNVTETASSSRTEIPENETRDGSVERTETTSTEEPLPLSEPSNEVVSVAPSTSNIRTILFNIRRPRRNYRKRQAPIDSDSSTDSDDISADDVAASPSHQAANSDDSEEPPELDLQRFIDNLTDADDSGSGIDLSQSNDDSNSSYSDEGQMLSVESDTEDETPWTRDREDEDEDDSKVPEVLLKTRPKHDYVILKDVINREMGISQPPNITSARSDHRNFERRFYGSLHSAYRLKLAHRLQGHMGCVNAIDFHPEGKLLVSGSDDMNVIVWEWATGTVLQTVRTGHKANVFQSKFLHLNARSQLNIVTCARDGQVRLIQCPPSGGLPAGRRRRLLAHTRAALKLHVSAAAPHDVVSAGEDGQVLHADVRVDRPNKLFTVKSKSVVIPLYSVCGHPARTELLAVAGRDRFVRVYDTRKPSSPLALYCPHAFTDNVNASRKNFHISMMHLTCAVYNHDGSEILASYNDEDIYLFDTKNDVYDKDSLKAGYSRRYSGHRNVATFKGVSYWGPGGRCVASGSDCGHLFLWDKESEALVQWRRGDAAGVVNCIETHPSVPAMATSGLDKDVKIWLPRAHQDVSYEGLDKVIRNNSVSRLRTSLLDDFLPPSAFPVGDGRGPFDGNVCTAF